MHLSSTFSRLVYFQLYVTLASFLTSFYWGLSKFWNFHFNDYLGETSPSQLSQKSYEFVYINPKSGKLCRKNSVCYHEFCLCNTVTIINNSTKNRSFLSPSLSNSLFIISKGFVWSISSTFTLKNNFHQDFWYTIIYRELVTIIFIMQST